MKLFLLNFDDDRHVGIYSSLDEAKKVAQKHGVFSEWEKDTDLDGRCCWWAKCELAIEGYVYGEWTIVEFELNVTKELACSTDQMTELRDYVSIWHRGSYAQVTFDTREPSGLGRERKANIPEAEIDALVKRLLAEGFRSHNGDDNFLVRYRIVNKNEFELSR